MVAARVILVGFGVAIFYFMLQLITILIWSDLVKPLRVLTVFDFGRLSDHGRKAGLCLSGSARCRVFPPEPPVAMRVWPERRGAVKGAPLFGAAKRTLDGEHRSGIDQAFDGRRGGNTFLLVSFERWFWTAGPMTAQEHTRRLITLIFAGRNRMVMIRRELPRTKRAGWVRKPYRIEA